MAILFTRPFMRIQLITLGGLHVFGDAPELERLLSRRSRAALLIYLTIERRVSRESLTAMFWPESDGPRTRHALRQSLYHLRKILDCGDWIITRAHELVVCGDITTDAVAFNDAVERR